MAHDPTTIHVRAAASGDLESLTWIISHLSPFILCQARERLKGPLREHYDPEDLVQEVWAVTVPRMGDLVARDGRLTPVLMRFVSQTLLNVYRDWLKKHLTGKPPVVSSTRLGELPAPTCVEIHARAERSEIHRALDGALAGLTEKERQVFVMRGIEQTSNKVAAQLLDMRPNTVAVTYRRALEKLRDRIPEPLYSGLDHLD